MIRALDLCAGIGGFTSAINEVLPLAEIFTVENDRFARKTYKSMFGDHELATDIKELTIGAAGALTSPLAPRVLRSIRSTVPEIDVLTAGLPCQPHSLMGNRQGGFDERGELFWDVAAIIEARRPPLVILENVRAIKSVNGGVYFKSILSRLGEIGYNVRVWELNAADYGVPQVRRRIFVVASEFDLPLDPPTPVTERAWPTTWHLLERDAGEKYYLSERILPTILKDQHKGYSRPALINRVVARPLTRTMHKMHRASQDNYYSDPFIHGKWNPADGEVTLSSTHPNRIRRITPREAFRIQGFPEVLIDRALGCGMSDTQLYMQAGNAVPPPLVHAVMEHAITHAKDWYDRPENAAG